MSLHRTCERCHFVDKEGFGGFQYCSMSKRDIYTCFDCTSICDSCGINSAVILQCTKPLKYTCMVCYDKLT